MESPGKNVESAINRADSYDVIDEYIAEIYDRTETQHDDVGFIKSLIGERPVKVLEPFCGNGRILIPLAEYGYEITGLDLSRQMLRSLEKKFRKLPQAVRTRITFRISDVIADEWPSGFDVVILGGNCFYELATPQEQEHCIKAAAAALVAGGHLYLDNDHMEGELAPDWYAGGVREGVFPTGLCSDGTRITGTMETIWYDAPKRLVRFRRTATIESLDGNIRKKEWIQQKHPPSTGEMSAWLKKHGFIVEALRGDRRGSPYSDESPRVVFWAKKQ